MGRESEAAGARAAGRDAGSRVALRVLTYNIHRAIGVDRRFRPERILAILRRYDADVVMMQEVDEGARRSKGLDLARVLAEGAGYPHLAAGYNVSLRHRKGRYGNATLSRFPIVRERNIDLTIDHRKRRGCQHTTLEVPVAGGEPRHLEVFNLHLGLSAREREKQVGILVRSEEFECIHGGCSSLVAGDFNDWRSRLRPIFTEVFGFASATDRMPVGVDGAIPTYPSLAPRGALDRIYFRGRLRLHRCWRSRLQVARLASDHLPVIADFEASPHHG